MGKLGHLNQIEAFEFFTISLPRRSCLQADVGLDELVRAD